MTWYTLFVQDGGTYITHTPTPTEPSATVGVLTTPGEPDLVTHEWDAETRRWVPRPPAGRTILSKREFRRRFTPLERRAIRRAMTEHVSLDVRADLCEADAELRDATHVDVALPEVRELLEAYVTLSLLAAARVDEILRPAEVPS